MGGRLPGVGGIALQHRAVGGVRRHQRPHVGACIDGHVQQGRARLGQQGSQATFHVIACVDAGRGDAEDRKRVV
ncbi:hypothetical protein G6F23_016121 [Rhizopus arrhizus]|nr:hypothetical protein G6F23_016121 [Rhizopus arrhizus]